MRTGEWTCEIEARDRLTGHIADRDISCVDKGTDRQSERLPSACSPAKTEKRWFCLPQEAETAGWRAGRCAKGHARNTEMKFTAERLSARMWARFLYPRGWHDSVVGHHVRGGSLGCN
jgi:hypothetical protein